MAVRATDDHSWVHRIRYPDSVHCMEARQALAQYQPTVVLCSWPPANNDFEQAVFATASVQCYIVLGSVHRVACGNWAVYQAQRTFTTAHDLALSQLMLPPELGAAVYVFQRHEPG